MATKCLKNGVPIYVAKEVDLTVRPIDIALRAIDENYELNDGGCYRIRRLEENLYKDYLPKDYKFEDVITYQWNQKREHNDKGQFNFYYNLSKDAVSKSSMFLYMVLLLAVGIFGDLLAEIVKSLIRMCL